MLQNIGNLQKTHVTINILQLHFMNWALRTLIGYLITMINNYVGGDANIDGFMGIHEWVMLGYIIPK